MFEHEATGHQERRIASQRLIASLRQGQISRRDFVVRAAAFGFSGAAINVFLIACGGGASTTPAASTAASAAPSSSAAPSTGASTAPSASAAPSTGASVAPSASGAPAAGSTATRPAAATAATATRVASGTPTGSAVTGIPTAQGTLLGGEVPSNVVLADKQELRYPFVEITHADPGQATAVLEVEFILNCWDSLVTSNQLGDPKPAHATKYDISADGLTYTFTLRPGLKFSDGSPLTAKDYEWTWKRNLAPETASEYAQALYPIKGAEDYNTGKTTDRNSVQVKATNDTTLVVTLAEPAPYFLALVSTWTYVPLQQATIEKNKEKWVEAGNMVTAGKYKLQEWAHDQRMVIVADPNYYGEKPSLQQITFVIYQDITSSSLPAYEKGELDVVNSLSPDNLQRVKKDANLSKEFNQVPSSGTGFIVFDTSNTKSPVSKKEFRQAVYYALNRDNLCTNVLKGQYLPKTTLVPKGILGYLEQPPMPVDFKGDKAKARQLLQTAGYTGQELVYTHSDSATAKTIAQAIQADLKEVGINIRLDQLERKAFAAWREARKDQSFDMYVGGWFSDYEDPNNWYNFFFANADQEFWHCHYPQLESSKSFVDLIRKTNVLKDRAQRQAGFEQAEKQLLTDLPLVPIYNNADIVMVKPYVKGLVHTSIGQDLFGGVKILKR
jgi:oligopeptide transport system substrate-binding protein